MIISSRRKGIDSEMAGLKINNKEAKWRIIHCNEFYFILFIFSNEFKITVVILHS